VNSPCNPLIEDYTEIYVYYMIDEGVIPSIRRKMSLRRPRCMRKVVGLGVTLIDTYVPALTSHLSITEIQLQLSENITILAAM
jgi:hypothetical protein